MKRWKKAEKQAAQAFGVERNIRLNWGEEGPDTTEHPIFSIEVKSRKKISQFLKDGLAQATKYFPDKLPCLVLDERYRREQMVVMNMSHFQQLLQMIEDARSGSDLDAVLEIEPTSEGKFKIKVTQ
jgi:hypothetical protein